MKNIMTDSKYGYKSDIQYSYSTHDQLGSIATFCGVSDSGRVWMKEWADLPAAIIEKEESELVLNSIKDAGLSVELMTPPWPHSN